ncbi:MAG: signal peptidase I [Candidatus Delongbacteria bacterium]|nr:signal peptidase I [Candidatus Delongbacteria bacterium]
MNNPVEINDEKKKGNFRYSLFLILLIFILLSKAIFFEFFKVTSVSMMDTLLPGDFVLVNKFTYGANTPNRITIPFLNFTFGLPSYKFPAMNDIKMGDVVVISKQLPERPEKYIKRCVAVADQTVEIRFGKLYVDQFLVEELYLPSEAVHNKEESDIPPVVVPEGRIFVLGDNRNLSYDSRFFGFVETKDVIGKAMFIYSSIDGNGDFRWERFFKGVE